MGGRPVSSLAVIAEGDDPELVVRARELGDQLGIPVVEREGGEFELLLAVTAERLELRQPGERVRPVFVDFSSGEFARRVQGSGRRSLLARAIGFKGTPLRVVDATAGLGGDAMLMALLGCEVTAIERDSVVFALLQDGLERASMDGAFSEAAGRIHLVEADGVDYLGGREEVQEVVYLDPMFPVRRKTALPGRELQVLARLVGHGEMAEGEALLRAALEAGARRVVVKRADDGAVLAAPSGGGPAVQFSGRTVRFDTYLGSGEQMSNGPLVAEGRDG